MDKDKLFYACMIAFILGIAVAWFTQKQQHDHRDYRFTWNTHPITFTTCADTALVSRDRGHHLNYIPEKYKPYLKSKYRVK